VHAVHGQDVEVGNAPLRLVSTPQGVWVSVIGDGALVRIDPGTGDVDKRVRMRPAGSEPAGWPTTARPSGWSTRLATGSCRWTQRPGCSAVRSRSATNPAWSPLGLRGVVYVGNYTDGSVTRIRDDDVYTRSTGRACTSPQGLAVADIEFTDAVVADGDTVYAVVQNGPTVWAIDAKTRTVLGSLILDEAGPPNENVDATVVGNHLVVSHPSSLRLYDVPLDLLRD